MKNKVLLTLIFIALVLAAVLVIYLLNLPPVKPADSESSDLSDGISSADVHSEPAASAVSVPDVTIRDGHYIQPENAVWYLRLANDWNTLPDAYDTTYERVQVSGGQYFDSRAADALNSMISAANSENPELKMRAVSCYRSVELQRKLYENEVKRQVSYGYSQEEALIKAAAVVKRPGQSEHNTGLAADIGGSGNYSLESSFENTAAFAWLKANCAEYGFILRFPKGSEEITGVIYEPWHYRYVGRDAAADIMNRGITLEEYLQQTGQ